MSGGFNPIVDNRLMPVQTLLTGYQIPFYFGASQIPGALLLKPYSYHGSGLFHKGSLSKTHPGKLDFTTKKSDLDYHRDGHDVQGDPFQGYGVHHKKNKRRKK
jgi:hypothetical protein